MLIALNWRGKFIRFHRILISEFSRECGMLDSLG